MELLRLSRTLAAGSMMLLVVGCAPAIKNVAGRPTHYESVHSTGMVSGVGIQSQDIVAMTDKLVRDILATPQIADRKTPPRIIVDSKYFENLSSQPLNKDLIIERMRVELQRAAHGKLVFVDRQYASMVAKERQLKRSDKVDIGTTGLARAQYGADYRLAGKILSLDSDDAKNGAMQRYTQIDMELVDLETGAGVWSGLYEFKKAGQEDAIYR